MRIRLAILLAFALLAVAACGDDSGDDTASDDAASASADVESEGEDATSGDGDDADTADDADTSDEGDDSEDGDDSVDFGDIDLEGLCTGDVSAALDAASAFGGLDAGSVDFGNAADLYDSLAASGPSELSDDFAVLADALRQLDEAYGDLDLSDPTSLSSPEALADLEAAFSGLDEEALNEATENINTWYTETCV